MERIGRNVKQRRTSRGWTQQVLADRVGTSRIYVAQIEGGARDISLAMLERVAKALQVKPAELLK
jgi:transcriptional regulator with XRE-family HTH domain